MCLISELLFSAIPAEILTIPPVFKEDPLLPFGVSVNDSVLQTSIGSGSFGPFSKPDSPVSTCPFLGVDEDAIYVCMGS